MREDEKHRLRIIMTYSYKTKRDFQNLSTDKNYRSLVENSLWRRIRNCGYKPKNSIKSQHKVDHISALTACFRAKHSSFWPWSITLFSYYIRFWPKIYRETGSCLFNFSLQYVTKAIRYIWFIHKQTKYWIQCLKYKWIPGNEYIYFLYKQRN